jgi:hypothetical protein
MDQKKEDTLKDNSDIELLSVLLREIAKAGNELRSAEKDANKANRRLSFAIVLANRLLDRKKINGFESSRSKTQTTETHIRQ